MKLETSQTKIRVLQLLEKIKYKEAMIYQGQDSISKTMEQLHLIKIKAIIK